MSGVTSRSKYIFHISCKNSPLDSSTYGYYSSGLTPFRRCFTKEFLTACWIAGILVEPPTKMISSISETSQHLLILIYKVQLFFGLYSCFNFSNIALVRVFTKCLGPEAVAVIYNVDFRLSRRRQFNFCLFSSLFNLLKSNRIGF